MYKAATRTNSSLLKRIHKSAPAPSAYKLVISRREPPSSRGINAPHPILGPKCPGFSTGRTIRRFHPFEPQSLLVQWQRKWLVQPIISVKDGPTNAAARRSARMFSGKTNEKRNMEKQGKASLKSSQKQGTKETGCTLKKPSKKALSEGNASIKSNEMCVGNKSCGVGNTAQKNELFNIKHTVLDKRKRELSKPTLNKPKTKKLERKKAFTGRISTKSLEDFDRLQLIKGKLIRNLEEKWLSCENIKDTFANFPYYLNQNTRDLLLDCVAARVKNPDFSMFGEWLPCSSHLILLQGQPGTELYQEALVRALAHELWTSLLVVDSNILSAKDLKDDAHIAGLPLQGSKHGNVQSIVHAEDKVNKLALSLAKFEKMLDSRVKIFIRKHLEGKEDRKGWSKLALDVQNLKSRVLDLKHLEAKEDRKGWSKRALDLKNLKKKLYVPWKSLQFSAKENRKEMSKLVQVNNEDWENDLKNFLVTGREDQVKKLGKRGDELKKFGHDLIIGDHVSYKGSKATNRKTREKVNIGQEGFVTFISDSLPWKVCVKFQGEAEEVFCDASELEKVNSSASDEAWLARFPELPVEALCKVVVHRSPVIVHFPDIQQWFSSVPPNGRVLFSKKIKDLLSKVDAPVVFIASSFKEETTSPMASTVDWESLFSWILENQGKPAVISKVDEGPDDVSKIFKNVINISPPEEPQLLRIWHKELEEDKKKMKRARNLLLLKESLEKNCMKCAEIMDVDTFDLQLASESAEDVVGWARNMVYHSNLRRTCEGKLVIEKGCLQRSLVRLNAFKVANEEKMSLIVSLAENEYEKSLVSSVVLSHEIGVQFDEIGALEDVKRTLQDLIVLPLKRPELFKKGNLRKPCKGVLLFGPPGTGKTLVAKAVATEAGANFINVSTSSITSKFYGDDEKLVKALFALARKLSPAVIFVDEVDSLLGARGGSSEHEAMRRIKNEFMAAWDGLQSKESEQILVFATTNRPFDLDDAVIRRLPRRILVDLPNAENRAKILQKILANEDLDNTFSYESLALQTEGYSGSDLKNLCVTAAYVPIRELLEAEHQASNASHRSLPKAARPLCMNDFLQAKAKIGASLVYDAAAMIQLRQWNEQYGEGGSRCQKRMGFAP